MVKASKGSGSVQKFCIIQFCVVILETLHSIHSEIILILSPDLSVSVLRFLPHMCHKAFQRSQQKPDHSELLSLTLKAPIMTAADDIHKYFFIVFQRK